MAMQTEYDYHSNFNDDYTIPTRKMIRILSEDSRTSFTKLAADLGVSRRTVQNRLKTMENALDIRYTVELDEQKLGMPMPHIVMMEFAKKPDYGHIATLLQKSYIPQLAFTIRGKNQLCVYAIAASPIHYARWNSTMAILLSNYGVNMFTSEMTHKQLGFVPFRDELIDRLNIEPKMKEVVKLLNRDSRSSIHQLSKSLGKHFNTVTYTFNKLVDSGYIRRFTLTVGRQPGMVPDKFMMKYMIKEHRERDSAKARLAIVADDKDPIVNRYIFNSSLVGAWDHFGLGVFDSYKTGYEHCVGYYKQTMGRHIMKMDFDAIDKVILGRLPLRSVDVRAAYNVPNWTADFDGI